MCPNCGTEAEPDTTARGVVTFYNCRKCDFSTWDRADFGYSDAIDADSLARQFYAAERVITDDPFEDRAYVASQLKTAEPNPRQRELDAYLARIEDS